VDSKKARTPKNNHPWKQPFIVPKEISEWIAGKAINPKVNNYLTGGGKPQR
jgi:hypothetical protein